MADGIRLTGSVELGHVSAGGSTMASSRSRAVLRLTAVAGSTLLAGIYVYDRAGGDVFGLRGGQAPLQAREETSDEVLAGQADGALGSIEQTSGWPAGPVVVDDPYPYIQQQANSPSPFPPPVERTSLPELRPVFTDPPRRTVLPGSKSDSGIDISIGLQGSP
jgi:hypothetical protein